MRNPGLEPGSLAALEPESSASANSASSAYTFFTQFFIFAQICLSVKIAGLSAEHRYNMAFTKVFCFYFLAAEVLKTL